MCQSSICYNHLCHLCSFCNMVSMTTKLSNPFCSNVFLFVVNSSLPLIIKEWQVLFHLCSWDCVGKGIVWKSVVFKNMFLFFSLFSYPLSNLPLPGNTPIEHRTPKLGFTQGFHPHSALPDGTVDEKKPRWVRRTFKSDKFIIYLMKIKNAF